MQVRYRVLCCLIVSCAVLSCLVLSYRVLCCLIVSCAVLSITVTCQPLSLLLQVFFFGQYFSAWGIFVKKLAKAT